MLKETILIQTLIGLTLAQAFTEKQRKALLKRDAHQCNAPFCHRCNGHRKLEVHHVLPQRYAKRYGVDPDFPENALTICSNAHDEIHPDRVEAQKKYREDKGAFRRLSTERDEILDKKQPYWNTAHDRKMSTIAVRRTQKAEKEGWKFPEPGKSKKK